MKGPGISPEFGGGAAAVAFKAGPSLEGGLAGATGSIGKIEGIGASSIPTPEIGGGMLDAQTMPKTEIGADMLPADISAHLETKLDTPNIGIQEMADAKIGDLNNLPTSETLNNSGIPNPTEATTPETPNIETINDFTSTAELQPNATTGEADADKSMSLQSTETTTNLSQNTTGEPSQATENNEIQDMEASTSESNSTNAEKTSPETQNTSSPENTDKSKRTQALEAKIKDRTATTEDIKELRSLKQDPEQRRGELEQRALDGKITDEEARELTDLNKKEDKSNLTPEQQHEQLKQDIDKLGTEIVQKLANGQEVSEEDMSKLQNLRGQESLMNLGFSAEQARAAMKTMGEGSQRNERQIQAAKEIQEEIQKLMAIEVQLLSIPKNVDALRAQRKEVQKNAQQKHIEANNTKGDKEKMAKRGEEYGLYMQIVNINSAIVKQKYMVPVLEAKRQDIEQFVRRKIGITGGLQAVVEWAGAKTRNVATEVGVGIAEEWDYKTGNF